MPEININLVAVLLAAVSNIVVGMLWYGPLFGKMWMGLMGFTEESMKSMKMSMAQSMVGGFVAALIMAYVLSFDAYVWGQFFGATVQPAIFALQLAFWVWLGYIATTQLGVVLWEGKSWKLFFLNASYWLVSLIAMAYIVTFVK